MLFIHNFATHKFSDKTVRIFHTLQNMGNRRKRDFIGGHVNEEDGVLTTHVCGGVLNAFVLKFDLFELFRQVADNVLGRRYYTEGVVVEQRLFVRRINGNPMGSRLIAFIDIHHIGTRKLGELGQFVRRVATFVHSSGRWIRY